jgi:Kef-type K+ transport system membrane component KefB
MLPSPPPIPSSPADSLLHLLIALVVVILAARICGAICKRVHQPPVIGEIIAGLVLGPSLLGRAAPGVMQSLLPVSVAPALSIIAQIGIILFMFLVGVQLDLSRLPKKLHSTTAISLGSILLPFVLGCGVARWLFVRYSTGHVSFMVFALFVGVSLSVTAFPVLARILTDRGLQESPLGIIALTCAAADDVAAWCLLAVVVAIANADAGGAVRTLALTAVYVGGMLWIVRPLISRAIRASDRKAYASQPVMSVVIIALLLSALATEAAGIHAIFGAFLLGAIVPHDSIVARNVVHKLQDIVVVFFLPTFFALTGLRTEIGLMSTPMDWVLCGVITVTATLGKFGGTFAAARITGSSARDAASLGILMNTRGLMELIVLTVGLDMGVLSPTLFTMFVIMAVVTTLATTPVLDLLNRQPSARSPDFAIT